MMQVPIQIEPEDFHEARATERRRANLMASLRQQKKAPELIHILDISPTGCGFRSRWPLFSGTRIWLGLPGLETWPGTVVWFEDGRGGIAFERPLHPMVAERYASGAAAQG